MSFSLQEEQLNGCFPSPVTPTLLPLRPLRSSQSERKQMRCCSGPLVNENPAAAPGADPLPGGAAAG